MRKTLLLLPVFIFSIQSMGMSPGQEDAELCAIFDRAQIAAEQPSRFGLSSTSTSYSTNSRASTETPRCSSTHPESIPNRKILVATHCASAATSTFSSKNVSNTVINENKEPESPPVKRIKK